MGLSKKFIKKILNKLPYIRGLRAQVDRFQRHSYFPNGHFYSPVVDIDLIRQYESQIWKAPPLSNLIGIDLNTEQQLLLLKEFEKFYTEVPFPELPNEETRYYYQNSYYTYTDAIILYCFLRKFQPKRIIEVGSGFSSAAMLDSLDSLDATAELTFIEPYPERLYSLLSGEDKSQNHIIEKPVQEVPLSVFKALQAKDILFIDSSHVVKTGSDLHFLLFEILPILEKGVLIHFHDIFYPFEYPKEWVFEGRNWNEDYFLRSFLMYNPHFKIKFFSRYLSAFYPDQFDNMPLCKKNWGGNLWLEVQ